jgi:serine-type D-Ala-D-Ala carboxypeptidase/endopeptidase
VCLGAAADPIEALLADRLAGRDFAGIVVGILDADGRRFIARGRAGEGPTPPALNGDTIFEVGGVADAFVALLLADTVQRGEVQLTDPVAKYLPDVAVPGHGGKVITFEHLATHRSGLPRVPANLPRRDENPYANYTHEMLAEFLKTYELTRDPGDRYEPSPLGTALLGEALASKAGQPFGQLLKARVLDPIALGATSVNADTLERTRLATGYSLGNKPLPPARFRTLSAVGGLRSSANDLLTFLSVNMKPAGPLATAIADTQSLRGRVGALQDNSSLGWRIRGRGEEQVFWTAGRSGGFYTFIGWEPASARAIAVLHNQAITMDDVGFGVLEQLRENATTVDADALRAFAGEYEITRAMRIRITVEGRHLVAEIAGEPSETLTQDSELRFVFDHSEARLVFVRDASGAVAGLWLFREGRSMAARRIH